ncbi:MAG: LysM peptidoglycan-binding domain-containing protein [Chloroflexi bacterium]|nr:MAG: LysM peptidoglycan-binding domain-containing protein [Chloroflexota bacterium]
MSEKEGFGLRVLRYVALGLMAVLVVLGLQWALAGGRQVETAVSSTDVIPSPTPDFSQADISSAVVSSDSFTELPIINDTSLMPVPNPHTYQAKLPQHNFQIYKVKRGDTPNLIAAQFGISPETLLGGNPWLSQESSELQTGSELVILPVDGVLHTVKPGERLEDIAAQYDVPVEDIIAYAPNNLEFPYRLVPETQLLIPGAKIGQFYWTAPKSVAGTGAGGQNWAVVGTGTFIWPVNGRCITNYHWYGHPAIDIAVPEGTPVYASDRGTVTYASWAAGTYYDYGNLIVINHGNGFETFYAHLSSIGVYPGQTVEQGEWIGATGNTGRSSGPHIHFEIRINDYRDDPLFYLSGPTQNCT